MSGFLRKYSIASLICVFIGGLLFIATYRQIAVRSIIDLAQQNNITYGRAALRQVEAVLGDYLDSTANMTPEMARAHALPEALDLVIADLMRDAAVARVKIYSPRGLVVFSSKRDQIGRDQSDNPGFRSAMNGEVTAKLVYRDTFNSFDRETEDDNLVQTYIPVRARPTAPPHGVLELYTDVNNLVRAAEQAEYRILAGGAVVFLLLWIGLLLFVRRITRVIDSQQRLISERNATLATLSAQMLETEEAGRKRLAVELHEGLAQTLSAIKVALENTADRRASDTLSGRAGLVSLLQRTIGEVEALATELRPSSLDDLGLLPAISALCREVGRLHPDLEIEMRHMAAEDQISSPLKIVLYRSLETALYAIAWVGVATRVRIELHVEGEAIALLLGHDGKPVPDAAAGAEATADYLIGRLRARVILSGGELVVGRNESGETTLRAQWPRLRPQ